MKILILQLARLGDIYQTWPMIQGLKEKFPDATIDILVRPRFAIACEGLDSLHAKFELPMTGIFEPIIENPALINESLLTIETFLQDIKSNNYDWIINATFSPVSSFITHFLQTEHTKVSGYTRHSDGYLAIPDDVSAYFYAQVGIGKHNRIHISDIFCLLAELDYNKRFWKTDISKFSKYEIPFDNYIVFHIGASQKIKTYPAFKWRATITNLVKLTQIPIVLIGTSEEHKDSDFIATGFKETELLNLTNKTKLTDLFSIIGNAKLLVGCDSAPLHIASLTNTPTLNISFKAVNFWETGPKSEYCRVVYGDDDSDIPSETVARNIFEMLEHTPPSENTIYGIDEAPSYFCYNKYEDDFSWKLIRSLYVESVFPKITSQKIHTALIQISDTNQIMLQQLNEMDKTRDVARFKNIYDRGDDILTTIASVVPEIIPLITWFQTEKIRIEPGASQDIFNNTKQIHITLSHFLNAILTMEGPNESLDHKSE